MCGIVGYIGEKEAMPILLEGLEKLEYRGYDSAGISISGKIIKAEGHLKKLKEKIADEGYMSGNIGIGHTRWATHGEASELNSHPHVSNDKTVIAVHNGIIENYQELKEMLMQHGYKFYSQTDTEVIVNLMEYFYNEEGKEPMEALMKTMREIRGSYALVVMLREYPEELFACCKDSPMIIGQNTDECFVASDISALLKHTRNVYYMDDFEIAYIKKEQVTFYNLKKEIVEKEITKVTWEEECVKKEGFEHYMLKEIFEQPTTILNTIQEMEKVQKDTMLSDVNRIYIAACGSAYHVGVTLKYVIESLAELPVNVEVASEFRYRKIRKEKGDLVVVISQSGETADSIAALRKSKSLGITTLGIVNVVGSTIAREADYVLYTVAGPEISVATTKAYSAQLIVGYWIALKLALLNNKITKDIYAEMQKELCELPKKINTILQGKEKIQSLAKKFIHAKDAFFVGRGMDFGTCLEGSLKMKEISYIHSEAYPAGELKHGTISLIEEGTLVVGVIIQEELKEKTLSNLMEVKSRGAYLAVVSNEEVNSDFTFCIPETNPYFTTSLAVIPLQLLGYYLSVEKGLDVDKPRNLAKSVTVE